MKISTHDLLEYLYNHSLGTFRHSLRVGEELYGFACHLKMEAPEQIFILGALHDIGKLKIPASLLNKKEPLSKQEFSKIKLHTLYGKEIIANCKEFPLDFANVILYHHENLDGSGYFGLKGEDVIPLLSRAIRIVDTYDTMMYGRPYQKSVPQEQVIQEISSLSGKYYDRKLVEAYIDFLSTKYRVYDNMILENQY